MRTHSPKANSPPDLKSVIVATTRLWWQYRLTYDQTHSVVLETTQISAESSAAMIPESYQKAPGE
jgi:hypothetical protein